MEDAEVVARYLAGDTESFALLYRRYKAQVHTRMWSMLGNAADAEEATQLVFTRASQRLRRFDPQKGKFFSWLTKLAVNVAWSMLRARGRRAQIDYLSDLHEAEPPSPLASPAEAYRLKVEDDWVVEFIAKRPELERQILKRRMEDKVSCAQIGREIGVPERTVQRALANLVLAIKRRTRRK